MNNLPEITFSRIMFYATGNHQHLKQAVTWEVVNKKFAALLKRFLKYDVRSISIDLVSQEHFPILMAVQDESYGAIDIRVLKGYSIRVPETKISFASGNLPANFGLPVGFAGAVSPPSSVDFSFGIGFNSDASFNDKEFTELLTSRSSTIKRISIVPTNAEIPVYFIDALSNLTVLKKFELHFVNAANIPAFDVGINLLKTVGNTKPKCVLLKNFRSTSNGFKMNKFAKELFKLLENREIQCLHLEEMEDWVAEWLNDSSLHNRTKTGTLCISNQYELRSALLWHSIPDYEILFPCVKNICLRLEFAIDDDSFDKLISSYFEDVHKSEVRVYLTVHLIHQLNDFPSTRFGCLHKLQKRGVRVEFTKINKTDARYIVKSKYDKIICQVLVCFESEDLYNAPDSITTRVDRDHSENDKRCLCVSKQ